MEGVKNRLARIRLRRVMGQTLRTKIKEGVESRLARIRLRRGMGKTLRTAYPSWGLVFAEEE